MPAYNFRKQFEPYILDRSKRHTIRSKRKRRTKVGERMCLFIGMRTKGCQRLLDSVCTGVQQIEITEERAVYIDGERLGPDECEELAWRDGFRFQLDPHRRSGCFDLMMDFWDGRLPFDGDLIHWE